MLTQATAMSSPRLSVPIDDRPTGSGKTSDAILRPSSSPLPITPPTLLLVPLRHLQDQILSNPLYAGHVSHLQSTLGRSPAEGMTYVSTYHYASLLLSKGLLPLSSFQTVIIDEIPRLFHYSTFQLQLGPLLHYLRPGYFPTSSTLIGLTATPSLLYSYLNADQSHPLHFSPIHHSSPSPTLLSSSISLMTHTSMSSHINSIAQSCLSSPSACHCVFEHSALSVATHVRLLRSMNIDAAGIISRHNHSWDPDLSDGLYDYLSSMRWSNLSISDWLLHRGDIPPTLQVLILNDAAMEGISIQDPSNRLSSMSVQSIDRSVIEQARARIRHPLSSLTVIFDQREWLLHWRLLRSAPLPSSMSPSSLRQIFDEERRSHLSLQIWQRQQRALASKGLSWDILGQRPDPPVCSVLLGPDGLFINPNLRPIVRYELDNLIFSPSESDRLSLSDHRYPTIREFADSLSSLSTDPSKPIPISDMRSYSVDAYNRLSVYLLDLSRYLDRRLTFSDRMSLLDQADLRGGAGWPTFRDYVSKMGYEWDKATETLRRSTERS